MSPRALTAIGGAVFFAASYWSSPGCRRLSFCVWRAADCVEAQPCIRRSPGFRSLPTVGDDELKRGDTRRYSGAKRVRPDAFARGRAVVEQVGATAAALSRWIGGKGRQGPTPGQTLSVTRVNTKTIIWLDKVDLVPIPSAKFQHSKRGRRGD